ncbi:efflux RND transporter periplasmic adaptor subunit [Gorillibacterium sp. sgz5001074]|uniref:efflux RND transporter periplasmic adaptor subunit n=1 Tax=Gorillibacterium sp. sgz5001074 TaxID=3446695 RepID=UPI003F66E74C
MNETKVTRVAAPRTRFLAALLAAGLMLVPLTGCGLGGGKKKEASAPAEPKVVAVETATVAEGEFANSAAYSGILTAASTSQVSSKIAGRVVQTMVNPGDRVKVGQPLARIDTSALQQQLTLAEAAAQVTEAQAEKVRQDLENGRLTAEKTLQLQDAQTFKTQSELANAVASAKQAVAVSEAQLAKARRDRENAITSAKEAVEAAELQLAKTAADVENAIAAAQMNTGGLIQTMSAAQAAASNAAAQLQLQVTQASNAYTAASEAYEKAVSEHNAAALPTLQANMDSAKNKLELLQLQLQQAQSTVAPAVAQANAQYMAAYAQLENAQKSQAVKLAEEQVEIQKLQLATVESATVEVAERQVDQARTALDNAIKSQPAADKLTAAQKAQAEQAYANTGSTGALQVVEAQKNQAGANVQVLQEQLKDGVLLSPVEGIVQAVLTPAGQNATAQSPVVSIVSMKPVQATVNVPETDIGTLQPGAPVLVSVPAVNGEYQGKVMGIKPGMDTATKTYGVIVKLEAESPLLLPGMYVQVNRPSAPHKAVRIPADAVLRQGESGAVYVVENGKAVKRKVQTGVLTGSAYEITEGLKPGEQLIVKGQTFVTDGSPVQVIPAGTEGQKP